MLTERVVPTPRGSGLVHTTLVMTVVWPGLRVGQHLEHLLGGDGEVYGADESEGCGVDEARVDEFTRVRLGHE